MNYERAYKAVLQTAKQWIKDGCTDKERICLEHIFPELRESEDERIRKELIEAFEAYDIESSWNLIPVKHILAWLEKQKEQEPDIELIQRSWYREGYHDREFGKEPRWIIKTGEGGPKHELNPKYGQPLAEEQSTIPSRETILGIWELGNIWKENPEERNGTTMLQYIQENWLEKCDYIEEQNPAPIFKVGDRIKLKSEPKYPVREIVNIKDGAYYFDTDVYLPFKEQGRWEAEQKPAAMVNGEPISTENQSVDIPLTEWSEEDEDMLNCCISSIEEAKENRYAYKETDGDTSYDREIDWLKSLRPSWKPSEWNREDKNRHYYLCNLLRETYDKVDKGSCIDDAISWLEDLPTRVSLSSWKPSEEQMKALQKAVHKLARSDVSDSVRLSIMYDNLKKLM